MELRHLRHFCVLAETLNFSGAARRLHIAQPALSISIRKLEAELGAPLFARGSRHVELTEVGRLALPSARAALRAADELGSAVRGFWDGQAGTVRVGFVASATYRLLPRVIPAFRQRYPAVELDLQEGNTQQLIRMIETDALDLAIIRHPLLASIDYAPLPSEDDRLVAVLPAGHALAQKATLKISDLAEEKLIIYAQKHVPALHAAVMLACHRAGFAPQVIQEAVHFHTVISLVRSGIGLGLVPSVCGMTQNPQVILRPFTGQGDALKVGLGVVVNPERVSALVNAFRSVLEADPAP